MKEDDTVSVGQEVVIVDAGNVPDDDSAGDKAPEKEPEPAKAPQKKAEAAPKPPPKPEKKAEPAKPKPAPSAPPAQVLTLAAGMRWLDHNADSLLSYCVNSVWAHLGKGGPAALLLNRPLLCAG